MSVTYLLLMRVLLLLLIVGGAAGLLASATLILRPGRLVALGHFVNRWVSVRRVEKPLDRMVVMDQWYYRHSQAVGVFLLAGAMFIIYSFSVGLDRSRVLAGMAIVFAAPEAYLAWLLDAVTVTSLLGAGFAVAVSLLMLFRPALLHDFGQKTDRWLSMRRFLKPVEIPRQGVDQFVFHHAHGMGALLVLGSLYILFMALRWFV